MDKQLLRAILFPAGWIVVWFLLALAIKNILFAFTPDENVGGSVGAAISALVVTFLVGVVHYAERE